MRLTQLWAKAVSRIGMLQMEDAGGRFVTQRPVLSDLELELRKTMMLLGYAKVGATHHRLVHYRSSSRRGLHRLRRRT